MNEPETFRTRLLTLISLLLAVAALRWSYPVSMPLVTTVFVVAAAWPIKSWLERILPLGLSYVGTVISLLLILGSFFAVIYVAIGQIVQILVQDQEQLRELYETYDAWARERGLPPPGGEGGYERLIVIAQDVFWRTYSLLAYIGIISILVVLGLPEVPALASKFRKELHAGENREFLDTVEKIANKFRQYIGVTVLTSLITGVASGVWAFAIGLDLALTWGVLNFLLNFIPVIGNIVGIIPPTLYAIVQFDGWTMPVVVFVGFALLQITISNFVYPMLQGRGMAMPPVAIILALLFWGWLWGPAGALLAVPLTAALIIICEHFKSTEKIARFLSRDE